MNRVRATAFVLFRICLLGLAFCFAASSGAAETSGKHCRYQKISTLPIDMKGHRPLVKGSINGQPVRMVIDSGAGATTLNRGLAERLSLPLTHTKMTAYGVGGASEVYAARVSEISIGAVHGGARYLYLNWDSALDGELDVLVGADFLFQNDVELSLADRKLDFFHPVDCADAFLAYWDREASVAAIEAVDEHQSRIQLTVEINGQKVRAIVDTGAPTSSIDLKAARRAGIDVNGPGAKPIADVSGIGGRKRKRWVVPVASVVVGDEQIHDVRIEVGDFIAPMQEESGSMAIASMLASEPEMLLGLDFLEAYRVLFAVSQRRMYLSYIGGSVFLDRLSDHPAEATRASP
jgi:predicted aspartyl protease